MGKFSKKLSFKRNVDFIRKKSVRGSGSFDRMIKDSFNIFIPQQGTNRVRLLPANPEYWGISLFVHYIGETESPYLCPAKMQAKDCPVCEERRRADASGDTEYGKALFPRERLLVWIIDREKEAEGPRLWDMPKTVEIDLNHAAIDEDTNEALPLDDPEEGYDIRFNKEGKGKMTRYSGITVARRVSPICDDEAKMEQWLEFIVENALEKCIIVYHYDHIKSVFTGKSVASTPATPATSETEKPDEPVKKDEVAEELDDPEEATDSPWHEDEDIGEKEAGEEGVVSSTMADLRRKMSQRKGSKGG